LLIKKITAALGACLFLGSVGAQPTDASTPKEQTQSAQPAPAAAGATSAASAVLEVVVGQSDQTTEAVKTLFRERFGNMPVAEVRHAPFGLFEVQLGTHLVYTNEGVNFVMDGNLIDAQTRRDITEDRREALSRVDFKALPLDLAITQVRGKGTRKMAIFEDPNCGYCKQLRRSMVGIDDLTVYTFLLPILSEDSTRKVRNTWCAADRSATWDAWMLSGKVPPDMTCEVPLDQFRQLAQRLGIQGTPAIFFEDGSRVPGAISKDELEKRLK